MCTLTLAWQTFDSHPLVVAANRDEAYARDSSPPRSMELPSGRRAVAPRDEEAGGTWMGYNEDGVFVAITNRWVQLPEGERSRGRLVLDALDSPSAADAARTVERELDEHRYEGFYLLLADAEDCLLVTDEGADSTTRFEPGVHVVMNVGYDTSYFVPEFRPRPAERQAANGRRLVEYLQPDPDERAGDWRERAAGALGDHEFGVCIHGGQPVENDGDSNPDRAPEGFGTKSSSLVTLDEDGDGEFWYADGPPCETEYEHVGASV
ncbi:NRDE family protein [Halomarina salina]|uniref:NRDE family protein n=1 Tax=Halomarina salina TaxID=1872699 RepID=A0ABD5RH51_9EURY